MNCYVTRISKQYYRVNSLLRTNTSASFLLVKTVFYKGDIYDAVAHKIKYNPQIQPDRKGTTYTSTINIL